MNSIFDRHSYGTTVFSPICGGLLSGKYNDGDVPDGTRFSDVAFFKMLLPKFFGPTTKEKSLKMLKDLAEISDEIGCTQAQLALAWTLVNKDVSTCIFGASKLDHVESNLKAVEVAANWTPEIEAKIEKALGTAPDPGMNYKKFAPNSLRRTGRVKYNYQPQ